MAKYINVLYFVFSAFILGFSLTLIFKGEGVLWQNLLIGLIGLYFLYRGIAVTVNNKRRRENERLLDEDRKNDPDNA